MRSKEDAQDYRYFPDPDLVPIRISDEWIEAVKERQPELQDAKAERYKEEFDIPEYDIGIITGSKSIRQISLKRRPQSATTRKRYPTGLWVETMRLLKEKEMEPEDITFIAGKSGQR